MQILHHRWRDWRFSLGIIFVIALAFSGAPASATTVTLSGDVIVNEIVATQTDRALRWSDDSPEEQGPDPRLAWTFVGFDDTAWESGPGGLGFGDGDDATDLLVQIRSRTPSLYIRKVFSVDAQNAASTATVRFTMDYDDGFIAFLNGREIARSLNMGLPGEFYAHNTPVGGAGHEASISGGPGVETFTLGAAEDMLVVGENALSVQIHNSSLTDDDMSAIADLLLGGRTTDTMLVRHEEDWLYFVGTTEPVDEASVFEKVPFARAGSGVPWLAPDFDDSNWARAMLTYKPDGIKIQAEDYKTGGEGVAYHDTTSGNSGGKYRSDGVDINSTSTGEGFKIVSSIYGEWVKYDLSIAEAGVYCLRVSAATNDAADRTIHFEIDGQPAGGQFTLPNTRGFDNWASTALRDIPLEAGQHELTLFFDDSRVDVDYMELRKSAPPGAGSGASLYARQTFVADGAAASSTNSLELKMEYRGGFVAYLNGHEVARRNVGAVSGFLFHDQPAYHRNNTSAVETYTIGSALSILTTGTNVLAIQLHQPFGEASDIQSLRAELGGPADLVRDTNLWSYHLGATAPSGGLTDETHVLQDWIELHNRGTSSTAIGGWALTDNPDDPNKWTFPKGTTIGAKKYLVVFASGKDSVTSQSFHLNFKLEGSGEYLGLYNNATPRQAVFEVQPGLPAQSHFYSWGRAEPSEAYGFLDPPTPGGPNADAVVLEGIAAKPVFGIVGGFHSAAISVEISSDTPDALIRYTTNGQSPTLQTGSDYAGPLSVTKNTVLRARAYETSMAPSAVATRTYLIAQSSKTRSLPAISLVTDPERNIYAPHGTTAIVGGYYSSGVWTPRNVNDYNNCIMHGKGVEHFTSVELLFPNAASGPGFQADCGIRLTGSDWMRPRYKTSDKFSFRLYFRDDYGVDALEYPLFYDAGVTNFKRINLRAGHNDRTNPFIRDELARRLAYDTGIPTARGMFCYLFINGAQKGYFNPTERCDEHFFRAWHNSDKDWDVIHIGGLKSGTLDKWTEAKTMAQTLNLANYANYEKFEKIFDTQAFADYLLVNIYGATWDWPHNNWGVAAEHSPEGRLAHYVWDAEGAFQSDRVTRNVFTSDLKGTGSDMAALYDNLDASYEFRLLFADRIQKHFFNNGALTDANIIKHHNELRSIVGTAIGSFNNTIITQFVPTRRGYLFGSTGDFAGAGVWPTLLAPTFSLSSGTVSPGAPLLLTNPNGAKGILYYTTDGTDPRIKGTGAVSSTALVATEPLAINTTQVIRARVLDGSTWSPLDERFYHVDSQPGDCIITEIQGNPAGDDTNKEWFELFNTTDLPININGWTIADNGNDRHTIRLSVEDDATNLLIVPSKGYLTIGASTDPVLNAGAPVDYAYGKDIALGRDNDEVCLLQDDRLIHSVAYGDYTTHPLAIATVAAASPGQNQAIGMAENYWDKPTNFWIRQTSPYGPEGNIGTPGADNDGLYVGPGTDRTPPQFIEARFIRSDKILLRFSDILNETTIRAIANYALAPGGTTPATASRENYTMVELRFADPLAPDTDYTLDIARLEDLFGNIMAPAQAVIRFSAPKVTISEFMYNPPAGDAFEFIELRNASPDVTASLEGYALTGGISFTFAAEAEIAPGGYLLVVQDDLTDDFASFRARYGLGAETQMVGPYGGNLSNGGERVALIDTAAQDMELFAFTYDDARGWPQEADGAGHALVPLARALDAASAGSLDYGRNWRASAYIGGSPGRDNPEPPNDVLINELAAHTDFSDPAYPGHDSNDWIEIHNPTSETIVLDHCYLSDDPTSLTRWAIPDGTSITAGGFITFDEITGFHNSLDTGFGLSQSGEYVLLTRLPPEGQAADARVVDCVRFKGQENGVTLGRYPDGAPYWFAMPPTPAQNNATPPTRLAIDEIHYNPPIGNDLEFVEILNSTSSTLSLENAEGAWRLDGGISFRFPPGATIAPGARLIVTQFDPAADANALESFLTAYGLETDDISAGSIFGPFSGNLSNQGERLALEKPLAPAVPGDDIAWAIVDEVIYHDSLPFPSEADGAGQSFQRLSSVASGNNPSNWTVAFPSPAGQASGFITLQTSAANGAITRDPDQTIYLPGANITLTPLPNPSYRFSHWRGDVPPGEEKSNPLILTLDSPATIEAVFLALPWDRESALWVIR